MLLVLQILQILQIPNVDPSLYVLFSIGNTCWIWRVSIYIVATFHSVLDFCKIWQAGILSIGIIPLCGIMVLDRLLNRWYATHMDVEFANNDLDRLEADPVFDMCLPPGVVKAYRKRLQGIRAAVDERDLFAIKSWRFKKLDGERYGEYQIRLNDQFRIILEIVQNDRGKTIRIVEVGDPH